MRSRIADLSLVRYQVHVVYEVADNCCARRLAIALTQPLGATAVIYRLGTYFTESTRGNERVTLRRGHRRMTRAVREGRRSGSQELTC